jgi:hypothetical protein
MKMNERPQNIPRRLIRSINFALHKLPLPILDTSHTYTRTANSRNQLGKPELADSRSGDHVTDFHLSELWMRHIGNDTAAPARDHRAILGQALLKSCRYSLNWSQTLHSLS